MDRRPHHFAADGCCVWCRVTVERVSDRRAAPFCTERPDADVATEESMSDVSDVTGY